MARARSVPYYQRIIDDLRTKIARGKLKPGDKLPSTTQLAAEYDVSTFTVRSAISRLLEDGTLQGHQGVGVYVPPAP